MFLILLPFFVNVCVCIFVIATPTETKAINKFNAFIPGICNLDDCRNEYLRFLFFIHHFGTYVSTFYIWSKILLITFYWTYLDSLLSMRKFPGLFKSSRFVLKPYEWIIKKLRMWYFYNSFIWFKTNLGILNKPVIHTKLLYHLISFDGDSLTRIQKVIVLFRLFQKKCNVLGLVFSKLLSV